MFNNFPYTNFHNLNLDWIVKTVKLLFNKAVFSINNVEPDDEGNVTITGAELGAIGSINGKTPVDGAVTLTPSDVGAVALGQGVTKVNGFSPNSAGEVLAGTVRSINGISPASLPTPGNVVLTASDVGALSNSIDPVETVNGISPDANGNVNVGTVKSVNGSTPDSNGNVNLPTVAGVTSVCGIGPDAQGNVELTASDVDAIPAVEYITANTSIYIDGANGSDDNPGTQAEPIKTVAKLMELVNSYKVLNGYDLVIRFQGGTYSEIFSLNRPNTGITIAFDSATTLAGLSINGCPKNVVLQGQKLTILHTSGLTYSGNRLMSVINSTVTITCAIEIQSPTTNMVGLHVQSATVRDNTPLTFTGLFNFCFNAIAVSVLKILTIVAPTTNIGAFTQMTELVTTSINSGASYSGTTINTGAVVTVRS